VVHRLRTIGCLCNDEPMTDIAAMLLKASCRGETKGHLFVDLISLGRLVLGCLVCNGKI
jgi:hypothetical protein